MLRQEMEQDQELDRLDDINGDINPCRELVVNNREKTETVMSQMEQLSNLSNVVNCVQNSKHSKIFHHLNIKAVNKERCERQSNIESEDSQTLELDFGDMPEKLNKNILMHVKEFNQKYYILV